MNRTGPLEGVRVLELGQIAAGPFAGSLLADLGADVVKVESPQGDGMRQWPPLSGNAEDLAYSENFASINRNKRSVVFDLKDPKDVASLLQLCTTADIFLENFRPGVLARLGLDYDSLKVVNPRLIVCSISGYGQTGPYANRGAFDVTVQAMSGLMSVTGEQDGGPVKCGVPIGDFGAGLYAAYTITAALFQRHLTGCGTYIDCSMLGSLIGISALQTSEYFGTGHSAGKLGSAHPRNAPYQAFKASDTYFAIAAGNDRLWREVCDATGMPELASDPEYLTQTLRARNQHKLAAILGKEFSRQPASYWIDSFDQRGIPASPINKYSDVLADPQVTHLGLVHDLELPNGFKTRTTGFPIGIRGFEFRIHRIPPTLGQHTNQVVQEWAAMPSSGLTRGEKTEV